MHRTLSASFAIAARLRERNAVTGRECALSHGHLSRRVLTVPGPLHPDYFSGSKFQGRRSEHQKQTCFPSSLPEPPELRASARTNRRSESRGDHRFASAQTYGLPPQTFASWRALSSWSLPSNTPALL